MKHLFDSLRQIYSFGFLSPDVEYFRWHKKNMAIILGGWIKCIDLQYSSRRHVMSPAQRATVPQKVKNTLGGLPPEMAKDDGTLDDD